jgi:hypothetical protein
VVIGAGIVFAEPGMYEGVVRRLVVDLEEEELSRLEVGLELEGDNFERDGVEREGFRFGCDRTREGAHFFLIIARRVFIDERCCC